ncbi:MAG: 2-hydroxychromene-2-carboxylate isomerase [Pseudomonadales bacterium]|nr:2-hydroxychromene-2-carboxylate isomerase [Pseudomonadales bacterium]
MAKLEFFFDCSSPWTYLAFSRVEAICERARAEIIWRPVLVGGVFNAVNKELYEMRANPNPVKAKYNNKDLQDWARLCGIRLVWPKVFPVRAVDCMRGAFVALDAGCLPAYAKLVFESYWSEGKDISQHEILGEICAEIGLDEKKFFTGLLSEDVKARLRANTEALIERGGFGSPTMFINGDDMYFGNDRLPLVEKALGL